MSARDRACRIGLYRSLVDRLENDHRNRFTGDIRDDLAQATAAFCTAAIVRRVDKRDTGDNDEFEITGNQRIQKGDKISGAKRGT